MRGSNAATWVVLAAWARLLYSGRTCAQLNCGTGEPFNICEQGPYYHKRVKYDSWLSDNTPMITEYCYDYPSGEFDGSWTTDFPSQFINHRALCNTPPALFGSSLDPYEFDEARYLYRPNKNSHREEWTGAHPANPDNYPMNGGVFFSSPVDDYDWGIGGDMRDTENNAAGSGSVYYGRTSTVFYEIPDDDPAYEAPYITNIWLFWRPWAKCREKAYGRQNMFMNDIKSYQNDTIVAFEAVTSTDVNTFLVTEVFGKVRIIFNGEDYCYTGENDACKADPTLSCCQQDMNERPWWCQAANCTSDDIIYDPYPHLKTPQRQPVISVNFGADDQGGAIPPVTEPMIERDANGNRAFWGCNWTTREARDEGTDHDSAFMAFPGNANYCSDFPACTDKGCPTYGTCTEAWDSAAGAKKQTVVSRFFDRVVSNNGGWTLAHYMALAYLDRIGWNHTDVWDAWQQAENITDPSYVRPDTPQKYFAVNVEAYLTDASVVDTLSMTVLGAGSTALNGSMYPHDRATLLSVDSVGHNLIQRLLTLTTNQLGLLQGAVDASRQTRCNVTCDQGRISSNKFSCDCNTGYTGGGEYTGGPAYPECTWGADALGVDFATGSPLCVSNSTTSGSCTVAGAPSVSNGVLDPCCNGVVSSGYSCFVVCDAGFEVTGTLPSCLDGTFDPGSVSCTDVDECHLDMELEISPYVHLELSGSPSVAFTAGDLVEQGPSTNGTVLVSSSTKLVYVAMTGGSLDTQQPIAIRGTNFTNFTINSQRYFYNVPGGITSAPSTVTIRNMNVAQGDLINVTTNYKNTSRMEVYLSANINGSCSQAYVRSVETNVTTVTNVTDQTTSVTSSTTSFSTSTTEVYDYIYSANNVLPAPTPTVDGPVTSTISSNNTYSVTTTTVTSYTPISGVAHALPFTYRPGADEAGKTMYVSAERYDSYVLGTETIEETACGGLAMVQVTVGSSVCSSSDETCRNFPGGFTCSFVGKYDDVPLAAEATREPAKYDPIVFIDQGRKVTLQARGDHGDPYVVPSTTTSGGQIEAMWVEDDNGHVIIDKRFESGDIAQTVMRDCGLGSTINYVTPYLYSSDPSIGKRKGLRYNVEWEATVSRYDDMTYTGGSGPYSKNAASKPAVYRDTYLTVPDRTPYYEGDWTDVPEMATVLVRGCVGCGGVGCENVDMSGRCEDPSGKCVEVSTASCKGSRETLHPMTADNYIEAIWVRDQSERVVALKQFSPGSTQPEMEFDIAGVTPFPASLTPYSYGNAGGLWRGFTEEDPALSPGPMLSAAAAIVISIAGMVWWL